MKRIASMIVNIINNINDTCLQEQVKQEVIEICRHFPVPGIDN
jgi:glycine/serine hydroxymethyltransferase